MNGYSFSYSEVNCQEGHAPSAGSRRGSLSCVWWLPTVLDVLWLVAVELQPPPVFSWPSCFSVSVPRLFSSYKDNGLCIRGGLHPVWLHLTLITSANNLFPTKAKITGIRALQNPTHNKQTLTILAPREPCLNPRSDAFSTIACFASCVSCPCHLRVDPAHS